MPDASRSLGLTARLFDHFLNGFKKPLKELGIAAFMVFITYAIKYRSGRSPFAAWRQDFWEEAFPLILILSIFAAWHIVKAGISLAGELREESQQTIDPFPSIHFPVGHDRPRTVRVAPPVKLYKTKIAFAAGLGLIVICLLNVLAYQQGRDVKSPQSAANESVSTPTPTPAPASLPTPSPLQVSSPKTKRRVKHTKPCGWEDTLLGRC